MLTLEINKHQLFITNITELKGRYTHLNAEFQQMARRDKKPFKVNTAKKQRKTIALERLEISSKKLEIPREHFLQRWTQ